MPSNADIQHPLTSTTQKWDRYLAKYTENLPNDGMRAGSFTPFVSLYDRFLGRDHYFTPIVADPKCPAPPEDMFASEKSRDLHDPQDVTLYLDEIKVQPGLLRKKGSSRSKTVKPSRRVIKFQPRDKEVLSSSDEEDFALTRRPFVPRSLSSASSATLTNSRHANNSDPLNPPSRRFTGILDYSDYEEDLAVVGQKVTLRDDPNWVPEFIRRHSVRSSNGAKDSSRTTDLRTPSPPTTLTRSSGSPSFSLPPMPDGLTSVPATPSLIRAVDRITAAYTAQEAAFAQPSSLSPTTSSDQPPLKPWDSFWADVKAKARS